MPELKAIDWERLSNSTIEMCSGEVRWVPLSSMQAHRKKLQQRFTFTEYKNGKALASREEWRDVPTVSE